MFKFTTTFATAALLTVGLVSAQDCTRNATVVEGDTCDIISQKYASSTYQLASSNPLSIDSTCSNLQIGQEVCLGMRGMDCSKIYEVAEGDSCLGIEGIYGLGDGVLYANNPQIDMACSNIYIGEVLCVDTKTFPYSSSSAPSPTNIPTVALTATATATASASASASAGGNDAGDDANAYTSYVDVYATSTASWEPAASASASASASSDGASAEGSEVEYCDDDDQSPDCVPEDEIPFCDEQ